MELFVCMKYLNVDCVPLVNAGFSWPGPPLPRARIFVPELGRRRPCHRTCCAVCNGKLPKGNTPELRLGATCNTCSCNSPYARASPTGTAVSHSGTAIRMHSLSGSSRLRMLTQTNNSHPSKKWQEHSPTWVNTLAPSSCTSKRGSPEDLLASDRVKGKVQKMDEGMEAVLERTKWGRKTRRRGGVQCDAPMRVTMRTGGW